MRSARGYDVWIAPNDHGRAWSGGTLAQLSLPQLPKLGLPAEVSDTVALIDVLWLDSRTSEIVAAFEIEKSTSIYSGILRLHDLALSMPGCQDHLYLVAPDEREKEILAQLSRASLTVSGAPRPEYNLFRDLTCHCDAMARFGEVLGTLKRLSMQAC